MLAPNKRIADLIKLLDHFERLFEEIHGHPPEPTKKAGRE